MTCNNVCPMKEGLTRRQFLKFSVVGIGMATMFPLLAVSAEKEASEVKSELLTQDGNACTRCKKLVKDLIENEAKTISGYLGDGNSVTFLIGRGNKTAPEKSIALGNCSKGIQDKAALYVPGCPIPKDNVLAAIKQAAEKAKTDKKAKYAVLFGNAQK